MKCLVAIASYGTENDQYLLQLIEEYRSMSFDVDVVVLSNLVKPVPSGIELVVADLKGKDPCWLPFAHKEIFAERLEQFDLFIYSEDDTLIREKNLRAFLELSAILPATEVPGFLRFEVTPDGSLAYPEVHGHFHWEPESVVRRGEHILAFFTNEHSACYVLTREQLRNAIGSGGFLVPPHSGKYDLICSAATDSYTQCGLRKLISISHLEHFSVHHLSNKYVKSGHGLSSAELTRQISLLQRMANSCVKATSLFETETPLIDGWYSKDYYEPVQSAAVSLIPERTRTVLSIGCGWGATEAWLAEKGLAVTAIPLDPLVPGAAESARIEIVAGGFQETRKSLAGRQFDCIYLSNVLHLVPNPVELLNTFGTLLSPGGVTLVSVPHTTEMMTVWRNIRKSGRWVPNARNLPSAWKAIRKETRTADPESYHTIGFHLVSAKTVRQWFADSRMRIESFEFLLTKRAQKVGRFAVGLLDAWLAAEFVALAKMVAPIPSGQRPIGNAASGDPSARLDCQAILSSN